MCESALLTWDPLLLPGTLWRPKSWVALIPSFLLLPHVLWLLLSECILTQPLLSSTASALVKATVLSSRAALGLWDFALDTLTHSLYGSQWTPLWCESLQRLSTVENRNPDYCPARSCSSQLTACFFFFAMVALAAYAILFTWTAWRRVEPLYRTGFFFTFISWSKSGVLSLGTINI